jgi:hypothetical protein
MLIFILFYVVPFSKFLPFLYQAYTNFCVRLVKGDWLILRKKYLYRVNNTFSRFELVVQWFISTRFGKKTTRKHWVRSGKLAHVSVFDFKVHNQQLCNETATIRYTVRPRVCTSVFTVRRVGELQYAQRAGFFLFSFISNQKALYSCFLWANVLAWLSVI